MRPQGRQMWIQGDADAGQRAFRGDFVYLCHHPSLPLSREFQVPSAGGLVRAGFAGVGPGLRIFLKGWCLGDFPGSPVVKILLFHGRKQKFDPCLGK